MELENSLNDRQKAFVMTALLFERDEAVHLASFLPAGEQNAVKTALESLVSKSRKDKRQLIIDQLKMLSMERGKTPLMTVHPDWIIEVLKNETPRMIAAILRHLPGEQVAHILANLPPEILSNLPPLSETFSADPLLVQILRRKFEQNFHVPEGSLQVLSMAAIPHFLAVKLEIFFREMGFREVAMAFASLNEKTINLILRRLPPKDAAALRKRLEKKGEVSAERLSQAQTHLLSLDLDRTPPEQIILEAGFFVYTKALLPADLEGCRVVMQKFPKKLAAVLHRYIDRNLPLNSEKTVARYRKEVLDAVSEMQEDKK